MWRTSGELHTIDTRNSIINIIAINFIIIYITYSRRAQRTNLRGHDHEANSLK